MAPTLTLRPGTPTTLLAPTGLQLSGELGTSAITSSAGTAFFSDTFSTGNLNKTQNNFVWGGGNTGYVDVVSTSTYGLPNTPSGSNKCVRFNYDVSNNAELDFTADSVGAGYTSLFLRYYVYWPTGAESPTAGPQFARQGGSNNKMLRVYEATTDQLRAVFGCGGSTYGTDSAQASSAAGVAAGLAVGDEVVFIETGGPGFYNSPGVAPNQYTNGGANICGPGTTGFSRYARLASALTRGSWNKIEWQITSPTVTPSGWGAGNGIIRLWVNNTLLIETTVASQCPANTAMKGGYIYGFPNSPYTAGTQVFMADFAISSTGRV